MVANGLITHTRPASIARSVVAVIKKVGMERSHALVVYPTLKSFNVATLQAYRALGVTHVGTIPPDLRGDLHRRADSLFRIPGSS